MIPTVAPKQAKPKLTRDLRFTVRSDVHKEMAILRIKESKTNEQLLEDMIRVYQKHGTKTLAKA